MPAKMKLGKCNVGKNIAEFHKGKTYAKTARKFGKAKADKQAVAAGMNAAGMGKDPGDMSSRMAIQTKREHRM